MVNEYYRPAIMDPIALELLAKKIAQYIAITLQSNSNISKILNSNTKENIKKNQLLNKRFLQSTDLNKQIQTYKIKPKKYFKKTFEFNLTPPLSLGYFSGISVVDINQDNNLDMIVPNNNIINVVINDGIKNIKKIQLKTDNQGQFSAAYAIDINNDYWLDIIAINENGLNFFIQTAPETFKFTSLIPISNISSLCVNDIDNDLDNDIYVTRNFGKVAIDGNNAPPNKLIENIGNNTFKIKSMPNIESTKFSSGCSILDINNDTLNDIIVINEFGNNELFLQEIPNQFSNKSNRYGFNDSGGSINLNIVDFNHDEFWDIFISMVDIFNNQISLKGISNPSPIFDQIMNISPVKMGNKIYLGSANKLENNSQKIIKSGVMGWSWGSAFFDYDNDSDQDFYITNGNFDLNSQNNDKNIFMLNHKNTLNFSNSISAESHEQNSRAVSSGDFNNDGDIDLVIKNTNKIIQFKNINKSKYPWLKIKLNGPTPNTYAIGSIITLHTNKKTLKKIILPQTGFLSQSPYIQHFGIGDQTIQKITIAWPDKLVSTIKPPVPINELLIIQHPTLIKN
ncbi:MAG: CRTAC1 family protein [Candidatus Margulisiibacteriota bacterium]